MEPGKIATARKASWRRWADPVRLHITSTTPFRHFAGRT
jgi:hypothetical protein